MLNRFLRLFGGSSPHNTVRPKPLLILGMHRSGTSCLAGMLRDAGVFMGEVSEANAYNRKGNLEGEATRINNAILSRLDADWQVPVIWTGEAVEQSAIGQLVLELASGAEREQSLFWGVKDPRMLFCLRAWEPYLDDVQYVGTYRSPARVRQSILARQKKSLLPRVDPIEIWTAYNKRLLDLHKQEQFPIVNFDWPAETYRSTVASICDGLSLDGAACEFFTEQLVHQSDPVDDVGAEAATLYGELSEIADANRAAVAARDSA